ncbi:MAG: riboflavin biosynthesis protein RibF [Ardenticatenales bacterium]|nr:riboflavin biosynthesis protein RibF [Ardenticatenales bacterium]
MTDDGLGLPVALTIGKFDGVHLGHHALSTRVRAVARDLGVKAAAVVLHPDPATVLAGRRVPVLTSMMDRMQLLMADGIEAVRWLTFTTEIAALSPAEFLDELDEWYDVQAVVVGPDFAFGKDRAGTLDVLRALGEERGFDVHVVAPVSVDGERAAAGRIRALLTEGDVARAGALIGRPFRLRGRVVEGAKRGRTLGFPTANLALDDDYQLPANGIYTVRAHLQLPDGRDLTKGGAANIGIRPHFDDGDAQTVEVHIIDWDGDLYGTPMAVDFIAFQRPEARFDDVAGLIAQMTSDVERARGEWGG